MQILNKKDRKHILSKRMQLCEPIFISIIHWLKTLQFQTQGGSTWVKKLTLTFLVYFKLGALQKFEIFKHFAKKNCYRSCWKLCPITFPYLSNQFVHIASFLRKFERKKFWYDQALSQIILQILRPINYLWLNAH